MKKSYHTTLRRPPPPHSPRASHAQPNCRPLQSAYPHRLPSFPANRGLDRPPGPAGRFRVQNFNVEIRCQSRGHGSIVVESVIAQCVPAPESTRVFDSGYAAALFFPRWAHAVEATVNLWGSRFDGAHGFVPRLAVPTGDCELQDRLRALFSDRVRRLIDGEEVITWRKKLQRLSLEIDTVSDKLRQPNRLGECSQLCARKKALIGERDLIAKRLGEFRSAMKCVLAHLEGNNGEDVIDEEDVKLFLRRGFRLESDLQFDFEGASTARRWAADLCLQEGDSSANSLPADNGIDWRDWFRKEYAVGSISC